LGPMKWAMTALSRCTSLSASAFRVLCLVSVLTVALARPAPVDDASLLHTNLRAVSAAGARSHRVTPRRFQVGYHAQRSPAPRPTPDVRAILTREQQALRRTRWLTWLHHDFWLHGVGSQLYTAWNAPITLKAINWYGFEYAPFVPDGLDQTPLDTILFSVRLLGFNALRITFADQTVQSDPIVTQGLNANPQLRGLHSLDIMEQILRRAHHFGLRVILCDSRSEAGRGPEIESGLWYTNEYPQSVWQADWIKLVTRFRNESAFVGADLRNEPHSVGSGVPDESTYFKNGPLWGAYHGTYYHDRDWHYAAQTLGNSLLSIQPDLLIIVEGVQMYMDSLTNKLTGALWGSNLIGVQYDPIQLTRQSQLVYSVHEYGPHMWQADWFNPKTTYASLETRWTNLWGYLLNANRYLQAPIFVGEFGTCHDYNACITDTAGWKQGFWFKSFIRYLHDHPQVGWAYWSLNSSGPFHPQDPNFYSLVSSDWHHYYPLTVRGLAPLLGEPDGTVNTWSQDRLRAFQPQPGCSPDRSCINSAAPQTIASAATSSTGPTPPTSTKLFPIQVTRDVPYVRPLDPYRTGDLYVPQNTGPTPRPAVIIVHGGSWDNGRKGTPGTVFLARGLAQYGYVTFDINYRLNGRGGQYPESIQDVEDAIAYLSTQAHTLNFDPAKLGVVGISAGGYLALMAGYRPNVAPFVAPHYPGTNVHVRAVGSLFAPVELKATVLNASGLPRAQKLAAYLGARYEHDRVLYKMASPLRYSQTAVPTIFWYGSADPTTPLAQTFELYKRLRQRQIRSGLMDLPGAPHSLVGLSPQSRDTVFRQLLGFLNSVFYHPTPWGG